MDSSIASESWEDCCFSLKRSRLAASPKAHAGSAYLDRGTRSRRDDSAKLIQCTQSVSASTGRQWSRAIFTVSNLATQGCETDVVLQNALLSVLGRGEKWQSACCWLRDLSRCGLQPTTSSYNSAVNAFCIRSSWKRAAVVFEIARHKRLDDVITCNNVLATLAKRTCWSRSLDMLLHMSRSFVSSTAMTLGAAIGACGACDNGLWQRALVLLGTAAELQVQPDGVMHSSCISMCEKGSQWQHGLLLLSHGASISCYNAAMSACSRCSGWQVALALFLELPSVSLRPDVISHNAMISSCFESWLLAMYFLDSLLHSRLQPTPVTLNAALSALGSEHWTAALGLLQLRDKNLLPDLITYHTLITCSKAEWQRACAWLTELNVQYLQKDLITCSAVITACTNSNEWKLALQFGGEASFGDARTFADTIGACDCGRRWQAALSSLQLLHVLALKSDLITINAARSACANQGSWQRVLCSLQEVSMEHSTMEEHASALTAYDTAVIACANAERH